MPAVTVAGAGYNRLFIATIVGRRGRMGIRGKVTVAALTAMRLIRSMRAGGIEAGDYTVVAEDADFASLSGTAEIQTVQPTSPQTTAAGAAFDMILMAAGVAEYALEVKSAGAAQIVCDFTID